MNYQYFYVENKKLILQNSINILTSKQTCVCTNIFNFIFYFVFITFGQSISSMLRSGHEISKKCCFFLHLKTWTLLDSDPEVSKKWIEAEVRVIKGLTAVKRIFKIKMKDTVPPPSPNSRASKTTPPFPETVRDVVL